MQWSVRGPARDQAFVSRAANATLVSFGAIQKNNTCGDDFISPYLEEIMRPPPTATSAEGGEHLRKELSQSFGTLFHESRKLEEEDQDERKDTIVMHSLYQLATATKLSLIDVLAGRKAFEAQDVENRGTLDFSGFVEAVLNLQKETHGTCASTAEVEQLCALTWKEDESGMDLLQFLYWFSNNGFSDVLLSEEDKWICRLSKQYQITRVEVENVKRHFDAYDEDKNGNIDMQEFTQIIKKSLQIPMELDVPEARIRHYWSQIDTDGSGIIEFQEFLPWWLNHFAKASAKKTLSKPFEDFYKMVRTLKRPDPPAYSSANMR